MKKINVWLIVATLLAVVVNPDESEPFWLFFFFFNAVMALVCKGIIYSNENEKRHE